MPLIEAMTLGLPIVCADLPYARGLCGGEAIYFNPLSASSAWEAIAELQRVTELQPDPEWIPEDREFKDKAQRLLTTLRQKR